MRTPRSSLLLVAAAALGLLAATSAPTGPSGSGLEVRELVRRAIELGRSGPGIEAADEPVYASEALPRFYLARGFAPAWSSDRGLLPVARRAVAVLAGAGEQGLRPENYHLEKIRELLSRIDRTAATGWAAEPATLADLDLLLTDGALLYAAHLVGGVIDPVTIHPEWNARRREADLAEFLARALDSGDLAGAYAGLLPDYPGYRGLVAELARYRRIAAGGGWPAVETGAALKPGDRGERVAVVRARLAAEGFAAEPAPSGTEPANTEPDLYDPGLEAAVRAFQGRYGLEADGVAGEKTLAALAVPVERRVEQLAVNLERWRWLPQDLGDRHLRVNIAGFELEERSGGHLVRSLRVVVGKSYSRTPVFSARMTYLVLNPVWNVPPKIARAELLAKVQKDPAYLDREGMRIFGGFAADAPAVDPSTVDWAALTPATLGYSFRQDPGPKNALGKIKFMFPNPYNVYLHDTSERKLFARAARSFSHGCIRVENPERLAEDLLAGDSRWTPERLKAAIDAGGSQTVLLPEPVPVHVLYWTAWVDAEGLLQFREDVYDRDLPVARALEMAPARVEPSAPLGPLVGAVGAEGTAAGADRGSRAPSHGLGS